MLPLSVFSVNLLSEHLLLLASILVFMAILVTKVGSRLGTPALLLFLLLQGGTLRKLAGWLKLCDTEPQRVQTFGMEVPEEMGRMRDHVVTEEDLAKGASDD